MVMVEYRLMQKQPLQLCLDDYPVGLISDTHGLIRQEALEALNGCRLIIHAGDVGKPHVLQLLQEVAPVVAVRGNVDMGDWAWELPSTQVVDFDGELFHVIHDLDRMSLDPAAAGMKAVIFGHSHVPTHMEKGGVAFINPGSAGPRRFQNPITLARLRLKEGRVEVTFIDLERPIRAKSDNG